MSTLLMRTEKKLKVKGKLNTVVREQYLRDDVLCHSPLCKACDYVVYNQGSACKEILLYKGATHYAIPYYDAIQQYLEILEFPEIKGLIILQSIASKVLAGQGRRQYKRLLNLSRDCRRGCAVFLNEICKQTSLERLSSQSEEEWLTKCTMNAAKYYAVHLDGLIPIVIVTETPELFQDKECDLNIRFMNIKTYLETFWHDLKEALDLYESIVIASSSLSCDIDSSKLYESYLPVEVLEAGVKSGQYVRGILRVNKYMSSQEAYVASTRLYGKEFGDILICGMKDRNRAIHCDEVVVELLPESQWKNKSSSLVTENNETKEIRENSQLCSNMPTGKIVGVTERRWRDYVASLPDETEEFGNSGRMSMERVLVVPYDYRIPKIRIATKQSELLRNQRIVVRIDRWEKDSQYPNGHFVRSLGEIGLLETEVKSLLLEHKISTVDFPPSVLQELPKSTVENPWTVDEKEVSRRRDLRHSHLIFSIDPKGCEDVDDALSVKKLPGGNMELGVHIADVTYFVSPGSLTDFEARSRATSVYLPDRRYDMLPQILSGNLCSLLGSVDRYAVSVMWELDENCEVQNVWFGRTVICSSYKLCYEDAEDILNNTDADTMQKKIQELQNLEDDLLHQRFSELKNAILNLVSISRALRAKRLAAGGLELNSVNMKFEIDKRLPSVITDFRQVVELEVHKTVAECMIFANYWVAKKISQAFPQQAVMRHHPVPREHDLQQLQKLASHKGFQMKINSNKELAQSLCEAYDSKDPSVNQIFRILATRAMNEAKYFCSGCVTPDDFYHYGLGITHYTHFTSPIRRYADILVHWLLLAAVKEQCESGLLKVSELEALCDHMNEKHRSAQDVEKAAEELFQAFYFSEQASNNAIKCLAEGIIYSVKANGVLVFIPCYAIKGALYLVNKDKKVAFVNEDIQDVQWVDGVVEVNETSLVIKALGLSWRYAVFDKILVRITVQKPRSHQPKISIELANNNLPAAVDVTDSQASSKTNSGDHQEANSKIIPTPEAQYNNMNTHEEEEEGETHLYHMLQCFRKMTLLPPVGWNA